MRSITVTTGKYPNVPQLKIKSIRMTSNPHIERSN